MYEEDFTIKLLVHDRCVEQCYGAGAYDYGYRYVFR